MKKQYTQPSLKAIEIDNQDVLMQMSIREPRAFRMSEQEVAERPEDSPVPADLWGSQW